MGNQNDERFGSDLYEGERTLFIHDSRKCPQKLFVVFWLYIIFWGVFFVGTTIGLIAEWANAGDWRELVAFVPLFFIVLLGTPLGWFLGYVLLRAWWGLLGQQTLCINREQIRHDWWGPWGKGGKTWPRDRKIIADIGPGDEVISAASIQLIIDKKKVRFYLTKRAEAEWLCERVERFFERTAAATSENDEKTLKKPPVKAQRGKLTDADSGFVFVQSFVETGRFNINGETLHHVESGVETHLHQKPDSHAPIPVRCGRCHAFVPPGRVLSDRSAGQCVECGTVFSIPELERGSPPKQKRITLEHGTDTQTGDTLRVTQGGDFSLYPVLTLLSTLFFLAVIWGIVAYVRQMYPDEGLQVLFPNLHDQSPFEHWLRIGVITALLGLFLLLPLWSFFERRTMLIDREHCRLEVRLLFFRWRRMIPRSEVRIAERNPVFLGGFRDICRLRYGGKKVKSFYFTFPNVQGDHLKSGSFWLRGEINRFLYDFPADDRAASSPDVSLGGMHREYEILQTHCPYCNHVFEQNDAFDLSQTKNRCPECDRIFALANLVRMPGVNVPQNLENFECVETPDRLVLCRLHHPDKTGARINFIGFILVFVIFAGMLIPMFLPNWDGSLGTTVFLVAMIVITLALMTIVCIDEARGTCEWRWLLTVDRRQLELMLTLKNRKKRIVVPLDEIRSVEHNSRLDLKSNALRFFYDKLPSMLQCSTGFGQHLLLHDGTRIYLPQISGKPRQSENRPHREWFVSMLNAHIRQKLSLKNGPSL